MPETSRHKMPFSFNWTLPFDLNPLKLTCRELNCRFTRRSLGSAASSKLGPALKSSTSQLQLSSPRTFSPSLVTIFTTLSIITFRIHHVERRNLSAAGPDRPRVAAASAREQQPRDVRDRARPLSRKARSRPSPVNTANTPAAWNVLNVTNGSRTRASRTSSASRRSGSRSRCGQA
jgi:hypothetical protein